jgi:hypothetical protein
VFYCPIPGAPKDPSLRQISSVNYSILFASDFMLYF